MPYDNGAVTLSKLASKYLKDVIATHFPKGTFITYSAYEKKPYVRGQVVIMWHLNSPTELALEHWEKANKLYPDAIYLVNSPILYNVLKGRYEKVYLLPRFIDPEELPKPKEIKTNETIWFGNVWKHHKDKFDKYLENNTAYISKGRHNLLGKLSRDETFGIINNTKVVYAIGLCAMEAKHLGCEVVEYDGNSYDVIYPQDAIYKLNEILDREVRHQTRK